MKIKPTKEEIENQAKAETEFEKIFKAANKEDQKKFLSLNEATKILTKDNIQFLMFYSINDGKDFGQCNNAIELSNDPNFDIQKWTESIALAILTYARDFLIRIHNKYGSTLKLKSPTLMDVGEILYYWFSNSLRKETIDQANKIKKGNSIKQ